MVAQPTTTFVQGPGGPLLRGQIVPVSQQTGQTVRQVLQQGATTAKPQVC